MVIYKNTKDNKFAETWQKNLKWLAYNLGKDKQTEFTTLLEATIKKAQAKKATQTELNKLESEKKKLGDIVGLHRRSQEKLTDLKTQTQKEPNNFLNNGTNQYNWWTKISTYLPTTYADNLYEGTLNGSSVKITEPEAIKLLTRAIKALEKIDETKFGVKYIASSHTSGTNHLPDIQKLAKDGLKDNKIIGKDGNGKDLPDKGKPANHQHLNRVEYSFKAQFVADADILKTPSATAFTPQSTETITKAKVDNFFAFIDDLSKDGTIKPEFLTELLADTDILKEVENNTEWKILPAQKNPLEADKLALYGLKVADDTKTKLYLSETDVNKAHKFPIQAGLKSWIELVHTFFPNGSSQRTKLASSFQSDPYLDLLADISSNTNATNWELPESVEDLQNIVDQLELDKLGASGRVMEIGKEKSTKTKELVEKEQELQAKNQELDQQIKEIIKKKREELAKTNIQKFDNETASGGKDNRKTRWELWSLQQLLLQIRYLENDGDSTLNSSVADENTAFIEVDKRLNKIRGDDNSKVYLVRSFVEDLSFNTETKESRDWKQALAKVKEKDSIFGDLNKYLEHFQEYEKIAKLDKNQQAAKEAIETELGQKPNESETLQTYQTKLKELDPLLTDTVITPSVVEDWQTQNRFKTAETMEAELKKVFKDNKLDADFTKLIQKEDAEITDIAKLFQKKKAQEIITLIEWFEYDKLDEDKKAEKKKKIVWTLEMKDKDNKYFEEDISGASITEKQIKDCLYDIAVGNKSLASTHKSNEPVNNPNPNGGDDGNKEMSAAKEWFGFGSVGKSLLAYFGIFAVIAIVVCAVFWKNIQSWWSEPEELGGEIEESEESSSDE